MCISSNDNLIKPAMDPRVVNTFANDTLNEMVTICEDAFLKKYKKHFKVSKDARKAGTLWLKTIMYQFADTLELKLITNTSKERNESNDREENDPA